MTTLELYERVLLSIPLEQRRFFDYLSDTIDEIVVTVPEEYVFCEGCTDPSVRPHMLSDPLWVEDVFHEAMVYHILYLAGRGDAYQSEFARLIERAYLRLWRRKYREKSRHFIRRARD